MPSNNALFVCFSCHKPRSPKKSANPVINGKGRSDSYADLPSFADTLHDNSMATKLPECSTKETVSLSATSQALGCGDTISTSLGGWSTVQQADAFDASKVNLVPSEDSGSIVRPTIGTLSHFNDLTDEFYDRLNSLVLRLEFITGLHNVSSVDGTGLQAFQSLIDEVLPRYLALSSELGPEIKRQSQQVHQAYECVRDLIKLSMVYAKPSPTIIEEYYKPLSLKLLEIADFDHKHPDPLCRLQLITVADSAIALAWCGSRTSAMFVREIRDAANAFANKTFQYCNKNHTRNAEWIRSWMACLQGLQAVVDDHFPLGLSWVANGPKAPVPPKLTPPILMCDQQRDTSFNTSSSPKRLIKKAPDNLPVQDGNVNHTVKLLKEISHTRMHLRHVPVLEFLM